MQDFRIGITVAAFAALLFSGQAMAQQRTLYGNDGRTVGRYTTDTQGTRTLYGPDGRTISRETRDGTVYDASSGHVLGKITRDKR